jgi:heat shock protein HtpX
LNKFDSAIRLAGGRQINVQDQDLLRFLRQEESQKVFLHLGRKTRMKGMNRAKTMLLLAVLTALFIGVGSALGGRTGLVIALLLAGAMNFASYWWSDKIVLRMYGAQEIGEREAPELFGIVRDLTARARLPMPKVYIIPEDTPNAFATGRNPQNAAVAVTEGLLRMLDRREITGVLAHELAHVQNRDTLVMTVAAAIGGALSMLANMAMWSSLLGGSSDDEEESGGVFGGLLGIIVAPIAASLIQTAISRSREFMADEAGARMSGDPLALASALGKIEAWSQQAPMQAGNPATAHLFIINPFGALSGRGLLSLFSTHPSTEDRIARLQAMSRSEIKLAA